MDRDKHASIIESIKTLKNFGLTQARIAKRVGVHATHITKLLDPVGYPTHTGSNNLRNDLRQLVQNVCLEHMKKILPDEAMAVLDTCDCGSAGINDEVKNKIRSVIRASLANAFANVLNNALANALDNALDPAPEPIPLPGGVDAALVSCGGSDLIIMKLDPGRKRSEQLQLMRHEVDHLIQRAKAEEPDDGDNNNTPQGTYARIV